MAKKEYVTKQVLSRALSPALRTASSKAMEVSGYIIKAENGWVVQVNKDGSEQKIKRTDSVKRPKKIILD